MKITVVALAFLLAVGGTSLSGYSAYDEIACAANADCSYDSQPLTEEEITEGTGDLILETTGYFINNIGIPKLIGHLFF